MSGKLPKDWRWKEYDNGANLYAPYGCLAGQVRKPSLFGDCYSHTWDEEGTGGENSTHSSIEEAKEFVEESILRQGFHMECDLDCSDNGDEEYAAEVAADYWKSLDEFGKGVLSAVVEAMLGPKRFNEWLKEISVGEQ